MFLKNLVLFNCTRLCVDSERNFTDRADGSPTHHFVLQEIAPKNTDFSVAICSRTTSPFDLKRVEKALKESIKHQEKRPRQEELRTRPHGEFITKASPRLAPNAKHLAFLDKIEEQMKALYFDDEDLNDKHIGKDGSILNHPAKMDSKRGLQNYPEDDSISETLEFFPSTNFSTKGFHCSLGTTTNQSLNTYVIDGAPCIIECNKVADNYPHPRLRDDTDDNSTISSIPNQNKNIGDICIKRSENRSSVAMDRNGRHLHGNMQTQLKSESSKHALDGNSTFHGKKFEPPNDSKKHLHKCISRKETPESRQDKERIPFPPVGSRRSTHMAETTFGRLPENVFSDVNSHIKTDKRSGMELDSTDSITRKDIQFNKDVYNERQSALSTPNDRSFQEKVTVKKVHRSRRGEAIHNEIPRKPDNEAHQMLSLEDNFSRNSKKNEGSSDFLYKEKDCLIPLKDQNCYDSIGSIRNSRNTSDVVNYGGGENQPMTHKRSSERKITNVDGDHYDTSSYMRDRGSQKSEKSVSIEPTETHNSTVPNRLSE